VTATTVLLAFLNIAGGFVLLTGAAEALVYGAASLARRVGLSALVIGLTVVSIGTSLPELVVSLEAALAGTEGLALGNVVGSNIGNLALILGVAALVQPLVVQAQVVRVEGPILVVVSLAFVGFILDGTLGRLDGGLLVAGIVAYVLYNLWAARRSPDDVQNTFDEGMPAQHTLWMDLGALMLGLIGLMGGARLLVAGAVTVAETFGVGPIVVGLTVVAVGTSLPELATSVVAARRGQGDIAVGNAVGSSIFNILGILGVTVLVHPLPTLSLGWVETAVMVGLSVLIIPLFRTDWRLSRAEGGALLACYAGYLAYLVTL
jgi:cation:H+ antiporter